MGALVGVGDVAGPLLQHRLVPVETQPARRRVAVPLLREVGAGDVLCLVLFLALLREVPPGDFFRVLITEIEQPDVAPARRFALRPRAEKAANRAPRACEMPSGVLSLFV